jgi:hypothetical protein
VIGEFALHSIPWFEALSIFKKLWTCNCYGPVSVSSLLTTRLEFDVFLLDANLCMNQRVIEIDFPGEVTEIDDWTV